MFITAHLFELKPSRMAWFFQSSIALVLLYSNYQILPWWAFAVFSVLLVLSFYLYRKKTTVLQCFSCLSEHLFSLKFINDTKIYQFELQQVVDHQLYIVLYWRTDDFKQSSVIWRDQLELKQWKYLKTLARLYKTKINA